MASTTKRNSTKRRRRQIGKTTAKRAPGRRILNSYRVTLLVLFVAAGLSLVVLGLARKTVDVDITVRVRQVSFQVSDKRTARLFNSVGTNSITVSQFERIDLGDGLLRLSNEKNRHNSQPGRENRSTGVEHQYLIAEEAFANVSFDAVTLNRLEIPPGTRTTLAWNEAEPNSIKISFNRSVSGEIAGGSKLEFSCTACQLEGSPEESQAVFTDALLTSAHNGQVVSFQGRSNSTIIDLDLIPKSTFKEHNISAIGELNFVHLEEGRLVSSIIEGNVKFDGFEISVGLREAAFLKLDQLQDAVINTVWFDNGINLNLSGRTKTLITGTESNLENRTPSLLEWIYTQHKWILAMQTLTLVVSSLLSLISWAGIFRKHSK